MSHILKNCLNCNSEFTAPIREINRGNGKFCCMKCSGEHNGKTRPKPQSNVKCSFCEKMFYMNDSKKKNSKSGLYFCCRDHKDAAQRIGGIKSIMPPHYGTAQPDDNKHYRRIAFSNKPKKCERCGYDHNEAAIIVHHIDRNRMNDSINNLEVLCANCHAIEHWGEEEIIVS